MNKDWKLLIIFLLTWLVCILYSQLKQCKILASNTLKVSHNIDTTSVQFATFSTPLSPTDKKCPIHDNTQWNTDVKPKYQLDRSKILTTVGVSGPNNQLISFRELIFVAIKLNRTVVPIPFFKHKQSDPSADDGMVFVETFLRIDINHLMELVPLLAPSKLGEMCNNGFTSVYITGGLCKGESMKRLKQTCTYMNLNCSDSNDMFILDSCPDIKLPIYQQSAKYSKDHMSITKDFATADQCPLLAFPYNMINFWRGTNKDSQDFSIEDSIIMNDIVRHTIRPKFILNLVDTFAEQYIKSKYISIHWRYNENDWLHGSCENGKSKKPICNQIKLMHKPPELAGAILNYLNIIRETEDVDYMYIAAPPSEQQLLQSVRNELLKSIPEFTIILQSEV